MRAYRQQSMGGKAPAERLLAFLLRKTSKLHSTFSENQEAQEDLICEIVSRTHLIKAGSKSFDCKVCWRQATRAESSGARRIASSQDQRLRLRLRLSFLFFCRCDRITFRLQASGMGLFYIFIHADVKALSHWQYHKVVAKLQSMAQSRSGFRVGLLFQVASGMRVRV